MPLVEPEGFQVVADAAELIEGSVFKIVLLDNEATADVILSLDQPLYLLVARTNFIRMHRDEGLPESEQRLRLGFVDVKWLD